MLFAAVYFNQYGLFVQCQWHLLPPSLARFSPNDPDSVLYSGYGLDMSLQFYSLTQKAVSTGVAVQVHSLFFVVKSAFRLHLVAGGKTIQTHPLADIHVYIM